MLKYKVEATGSYYVPKDFCKTFEVEVDPCSECPEDAAYDKAYKCVEKELESLGCCDLDGSGDFEYTIVDSPCLPLPQNAGYNRLANQNEGYVRATPRPC